MTAYYNEHDPFAAAWLRELIKERLIAAGDVDERDIQQVQADELRGYTQCHFFAGIGGWSLAFRLAGWPDDRPVWSGSCPCQPISGAGQRKGHADQRHLWPAFHRLIAERRPATVFGEQVGGTLGFEWLAGIRADLEADQYAVGAADIAAAGVGAPHIRQRLWWVADAEGVGRREVGQHVDRPASIGEGAGPPAGSSPRLAYAAGERHAGIDSLLRGDTPRRLEAAIPETPWSGGTLIACTDGKVRRVEPGIFPLAHGVPNRLGTLRGSGNAIVPQASAVFIGAYLDVRGR